MAAEQLEMRFTVIDGGKPEPYINYRKKLDAPAVEEDVEQEPLPKTD